MRLAGPVLCFVMTVLLLTPIADGEFRNRTAVGLLLGDPVAVGLRLPVTDKTFFGIRAGIWTWSFWHDIAYNTPYLALDYAAFLPVEMGSSGFYAGGGVAVFFADNPKDKEDYEAAVAVRLPFGFEYYVTDDLSLGLELAPIYQVAPPFSFKPYVIELNGGFVLNYYF